MPRHGENIRKRADGRWEGRYRTQDVVTGKMISRSVYAKTYAEVKEKLEIAKQTLPSYDIYVEKEPDAPSTDFQTLITKWLQSVEAGKKYSTFVKYRLISKNYIVPVLDEYGLQTIDLVKFKTVFSRIMEEEQQYMSDSLIKSIFCVVNQIFSYGALHYHTPEIHMTYRKRYVGNKPVEILNHTEQASLFRFLHHDMNHYKLGVVICFSTGLRLGEICALKWSDIDIDEKILRVNRTVQRIAVPGRDTKTSLLEGTPKSIFSLREIPLSDDLINLLFPFYGKGEYVVGVRKPVEPRTYQYHFRKFLKASGIGKKNFHITRHTFATNCINNGTDVKSLSEILGHSDVSITLNKYVHPTLATKRRHMNSLASIYGQFLGR